jgi:hypothetical protein
MQATGYRICIRDGVTERIGFALERMHFESGKAETVFAGEIRDQSELYGLLGRVCGLASNSSAQNHSPRLTHSDDPEAIRLRPYPQ